MRTPADWVEDPDFPAERFKDVIQRKAAEMMGADAKYLPGPDAVTSGEFLREYVDKPVQRAFEKAHREFEGPLRELLDKVRHEALAGQWEQFVAGRVGQKVFVLSRYEDHEAGWIESVHGSLEAAQRAGEALGCVAPWTSATHPRTATVWHDTTSGFSGYEIEELEVQP